MAVINSFNMLISTGELISRSFKLYRENFSLFAKYAFLIFVPVFILLIGFLAGGLGGVLTGALSESGGAGLGVGITIAIAAGLVFFYLTLWFTFTLIRVIAARYNGIMPGSVAEELKKARPVIVIGLLTSLLTGFIILGGIILFIIPGIIFSVWYYFAVYNTILDGHKPMDALRESKKMVAGRWFGVLWRLFAPGFVFGILAWIVQMVVSAPFLFMSGSNMFPIVNGLASTIVNILMAPLTSAAIAILYMELKKTPLPAAAPATLPMV